jgi:hypothetical protein
MLANRMRKAESSARVQAVTNGNLPRRLMRRIVVIGRGTFTTMEAAEGHSIQLKRFVHAHRLL